MGWALYHDGEIGKLPSMTLLQFQNRRDTPLTVLIEPADDRHILPPLAMIGIRRTCPPGAEARLMCDVSETQISIWCDDPPEIDIVLPSPFDLLLWHICVGSGWCGGIVGGVPTHVTDLLPKSGTVTARQFAELAIRADGWPDGEPFEEKHLHQLETAFITRMGAASAEAEALQMSLKRPFEDG